MWGEGLHDQEIDRDSPVVKSPVLENQGNFLLCPNPFAGVEAW
jgi:hypothetical protein